MKPVKVAINGFGRIGRLLLRQLVALPSFRKSEPGAIEIVAVNDLGNLENLAYLLKYDSVYGCFPGSVKFDTANSILDVDGKQIKFLQIKDPASLPWKDLDIDIAVEATGLFESYEKAKVHLVSGAKRVVITAPAKDDDFANGKTVLMGVNEDDLKTTVLSSNGSCTTNAASPVIQVLSENPGIVKAVLNTVHGYTATQNLVDGPVKGGQDFRRGRAAAHSIVPSTTGAAIAVTRAIKDLENKFDGVSLRVPVIAGSIADITFLAKRPVTAEEINDILRKAAQTERWQGILAVTEDQVVSADMIGVPYGAVVDLNFTKVVDGDLVKVLSWYDNEYGYAATLVRHLEAVARNL